ncbi:MAG: CCA tRNA nucleotidyltransferase [Bacteroidales bacterium]|nr:CCA tRNA nucleotidyltransferase [Bacteroidales bacterium]
MLSCLTHPVYAITGEVASQMGIRAFAVGGVIRDVFLHRTSKDIDIVVLGSGIEVAEAVAKSISDKIEVHCYKNFGTAQFMYHDAKIEFVGARKESYRPHSRKPVVENGTMVEDLKRRDFTINAFAVALNGNEKGMLIDLFNGLQDLHDKIIRTPLDPDFTFSDDPLRMMRAVRFASQLGFRIYDKTFKAIRRNAERLEIVSMERVMDEFNKILLSPKPSIGIRLLEESGLLRYFLPQLLDLKGVEYIEGKGHKDNFLHTLEVVDKVALASRDLWLLWAALLHDIAKSRTKKYDPEHGWTFHGHEILGSKMAFSIFRKLHLPANEKLKHVQKLIALHLRPIALVEDTITDSAVRRLLFEAGDDIDDLMLLCEADITSKNPEKVRRFLDNFAKVREKLKEIEEKDRLRNWQPPVDGELIMHTFQILPSQPVGIIKTTIREAILDGLIPNEKDAAVKLMIEEGEKLGLTVVNPPYGI